ncbi:hypothetical protein HK097_008133 [Rhizophlyctis rosea]|uniref:Uncharacterized protein n=1 Tax=Rhizophlyctis rosea TaxID=64517 RepID=A0AAD5X7X6_9FUNG|nr:hypothetical protein HK097_008133 [Rhizophlyctis rosea]
MWAATFVLLVFWALAHLVSAFFRGRTPATSTHDASTRRNGVFVHDAKTERHPIAWRARNAERTAQTLFLMLFAASTVTSFGYGATRATSALAWTFMVLAIIHILASAATRHFAPHIGLGILSFPFIIAIFALAFRGSGGIRDSDD